MLKIARLIAVLALGLLSASVAEDTGCDLSSEVPWPSATGYDCQPFDKAHEETLQFLLGNMPAFDAPNKATLFNNGVASEGISLSLMARQDTRLPWAKTVPKNTFLDAVAPYANVNEARVNWRALLSGSPGAIIDTLAGSTSIVEAQASINGYTDANASVWTVLTEAPIVFRSEQTPLIYDPMSTVVFGYASCTGISILFVDALRSVGIPARLAGTPAWNGAIVNGNHNWVEIWRPSSAGGGAWSPIEGKPAGGGESIDDPCSLWFCNAAHFPPDDPDAVTKVYAARFNQSSVTRYPMAWDLGNQDIAGEDRSEAYAAMCGSCGSKK